MTKYVSCAEKVLCELKKNQAPITVEDKAVCEVLSWVTHYLDDAKYYKAQGKFETSLTSVAYCEGLLDALRLIGAVNFEWPTKQQEKE
ncbi:MAG: DUF357 domain-containing protein [Candidatus Bathyarchaeota archaeon]|nr:DUF357 domain-containing protein [Candidatus Bathyarchaeota archaeon]MDI9577805.1 DUF357 domain-containing protein [Thermoproteota archaeon]